jgi:hypothetical protein
MITGTPMKASPYSTSSLFVMVLSERRSSTSFLSSAVKASVIVAMGSASDDTVRSKWRFDGEGGGA